MALKMGREGAGLASKAEESNAMNTRSLSLVHSLVLCVLLWVSPGPSIAAADSSIEALLDAVVTWLSANFELPADYDHPRIVLASAERLSNIRYKSVEPNQRREVVALYDEKTETILLTKSWRGRSPTDLSILVHEMVHHLQYRASLDFACSAAREAMAYAAQEQWLGLFGKTLVQEFEIDPVTLKLSTSCALH